MNVLYHTDALAKADQFGLARYAKCLVLDSHFKEKIKPSYFSVVPNAAEAINKSLGGSIESSVKTPRLPPKLLQGLWAAGVGPSLNAGVQCDMVHTLELDYPVVVSKKPWVATVHDIGPLTHTAYFSKSRPKLRDLGLRRAAKKADAIVAVSEATADAIREYLNDPLTDRLHVVHEGVETIYFDRVSSAHLDNLENMPSSETPFIFWAGTLNPRKNLEGVLMAFRQLIGELDHHLVIAGNVGWDSEKLLSEFRDPALRDRIHMLGFVSDLQLRALYQRAELFVYVSRMEGFGLPILEAMASRCPVVTSNVSSMPEVAGEAAEVVDPESSDDIASGIMRVFKDSERKDELIDLGVRRAKESSWSRCVEGVLDIYKNVKR